MKKELDYFTIEKSYGGNQDWFFDITMKMGGCAAVTACDSCIFLDKYKSTSLAPFKKTEITKKEYIGFSKQMKPYLRPRMSGINTLQLYIDGFDAYLNKKKSDTIALEGFSGEKEYTLAVEKVIEQVDAGFLIPTLLLRHKNVKFKDYVWHWFLIIGYQYENMASNDFLVKVVTYGSYRWLNLKDLWDTNYEQKGGMILFHAT